MKIRLGYACQSKTIDITSSSTITYTNYSKYNNVELIEEKIKKNLLSLKEILIYNKCNDIYFFRMSSQLIPLATKKEVVFNYIDNYRCIYDDISELIKEMRVDFHPDQFTVLNSIKPEVIQNSIENLEYHYNILKALNVKNKLILIHIGSSVFGKDKAIHRFIKNFEMLPIHLQKCIAIENDDKVYNIKDCLYIANKLNIPFVLDYHHYLCNNENEDILTYLPNIFNTFKNIQPKMHFSSPKSKLKKEFRTHHEYINCDEFVKLLKILKIINIDVDIMIEAKGKDEALFKLIRELKYLTSYKIVDTTIYL